MIGKINGDNSDKLTYFMYIYLYSYKNKQNIYHLNLSLIPLKHDLMQSLANGIYEAQYQM